MKLHINQSVETTPAGMSKAGKNIEEVKFVIPGVGTVFGKLYLDKVEAPNVAPKVRKAAQAPQAPAAAPSVSELEAVVERILGKMLGGAVPTPAKAK
jgi:hypothetical protein